MSRRSAQWLLLPALLAPALALANPTPHVESPVEEAHQTRRFRLLSPGPRDLSEGSEGDAPRGADGPRMGGLREGQLSVGVKLGTSFAIGFDELLEKEPAAVDMVMPSLHAGLDGRIRYGKTFVQLAPTLMLPATTYSEMAYGGIGADVGLGHIFREGSFSPYVVGGSSGRLVWAQDSFSPGLGVYGALGLTHDMGPDVSLFGEVRAMQNTLPLDVSGSDRITFPLEPGFAAGIAF